MWFQEGFFKYAVGTILVLIIIALLYYTAPVFAPILWFVAAVLLPILFSTFFYYALRPVVDFLERKMPRYVAILLTYFVIAFTATLVFFIVGPQITAEVKAISNISPEKIENIKSNTNEFVQRLDQYIPISSIESMFFNNLQKINAFIYALAVNMISTLTSIAVALALTPFVLFYFLRDGSLMPRYILRFVPADYQDEAQKILQDIDSTLSEFIIAQMTVAGIVGFFLFCGYLVIGLPDALSLALFAMIFYVIPVLGTFIAIIPALIVGLSMSLFMTIKVILVMFVAHILEADLITPRLMSQRLKIHPLTIILLLLAAGSLYGLLGLLLVTPTYAVVKVVIWNLYKIYRLRHAIAKTKTEKTLSQDVF